MPTVLFDGAAHQLTLRGDDGQVIGTWTAYNHVDSHATLTHVPNGTYRFQDRHAPHKHRADADGPYGLHGIFRFDLRGHPGIGVHSGRAHARHQPGPEHATMGCIRTTDDAMQAMVTASRASVLTTIEVTNNSAPVAHNATRRHRHTRLVGSGHPGSSAH